MARRKPLDPDEFITGLCEEMRAELDALHDALPRLEFLRIAGRREGAIKLTPLVDAAPEPRNLPEQRWCSLRPAPEQFARLCRCAGRLVAVGTPSRVGVGVPEHAVISGRNALRGAGQGALSVSLICCATIAVACSLVIIGSSAATSSSVAGPSSWAGESVFPLAAVCLIQSSAAA